MPRVKLLQRDKRTEKIFATLTPVEFAAVKAQAKAEGVTLSSWLRLLAMRHVSQKARN